MPKSKTKNVLLLMNSYELAEKIASYLDKNKYNPIIVGDIDSAIAQLESVYALIFTRHIPEQKNGLPITNAGVEFAKKLLEEKSHLRLGYYTARQEPNDLYKDTLKHCVCIYTPDRKTINTGLAKLLGSQKRT